MYKIISLLLLTVVTPSLMAQTIQGQVLESLNGVDSPLPGANVYWAGTQTGTTTDVEGAFKLSKRQRDKFLVASFVGYASDTIEVTGTQPLVFKLKSNAEIGTVEVVARERGTQLSRMTPLQQQIITGAELRKAACCNLSESFQTNASVDVNYSDAVTGAKQIQLLGLAGNYTQMMTENIPTLRGLASTYGLGYVPGSWMESIQVSKGTSQVVNGFESVTGQINIEYKKPTDKDKLYLNVYGNNFGKYEINANSAFSVNDKLKSIVLAHYENLGVINDHNHDGFVDDPLVRQYNLMNRWFYNPNPKLEMRFGFNVIDEDRRGGQTAFLDKDHAGMGEAYGIGIKTRRYNAYSKTGFFFNDPNKNLGIILDGTYHNQEAFFGHNKYSGTQKSLYANAIFQSSLGNTAPGATQSDTTVKAEHSFLTGLSMQADNFDEVLNDSLMGRTDLVPGAFFQYTWSVGTRFSLIAGLRADHFKGEGVVLTPRFHVRKALDQNSNTVLRLSAGRGLRNPNLVAENITLLASNRKALFSPYRNFEDAWNFGTSLLQNFTIAERTLTASVDFYHTRFDRQIIADIDRNPQRIYFYQLDGRSYSNSFQTEVKYNLLENLELTAAFRINDVKMTISDTLRQKPYISKYKGLFSASWASNNHHWKIDYTAQLNGPGRIPSTASNPVAHQRPDNFDAYTLMFAQVTRAFKRFDLYVGSENLTGFKQKNPVISANDPFGDSFDASMIWGPLSGRMWYAGIRYKL